MKIQSITKVESRHAVKTYDCEVGDGYLQGTGKAMSDVDIDYQADRRQEVKEYLERRYNTEGRQRVFSAGTFSTMKLKACLKDVCRVHRIPVSLAGYISAIIDSSDATWTDLFRLAARTPKVRKFVNDYPQAVEDMRPLLGQPRSASVHASAILITPETRDGEVAECFDFTPVKRVDGMLVSELDGYSLDEVGLLKNDCLGILELTKIQSVLDEINREYGTGLSFEEIVRSGLDDKKTYDLLCEGYTANIFQLSSAGMTRYLQDMQPASIGDLIAANALYRPATLDSGAAENYLRCRLGEVAPVYLWGTYEALHTTYGELIYQEQVSRLVRDVGGFSLAEGVRLVKLISKKKIDVIHAMREKFMAGAAEKGCPKEDALRIWDLIESAGIYLFNLSHATAYAITAYAGAWLKANYPTAFYTVALQYADDKEIVALMSEMERCSGARIVPPEINRSQVQFYTDYGSDSIYWSLGRIRMVGIKTAEYIVRERERGGEFSGIGDFIRRIFRHRLKKYRTWEDDLPPAEAERVPVNARHVRNLILAGCFDTVERIASVTERYGILQRAAVELGFALDERDYPAGEIAKHHFWARQQIAVSGIGAIDYRRIFEESEARAALKGKAAWMTLSEVLDPASDGRRAAVCATVAEATEHRYKDRTTGEQRRFLKLTLQQNNSLAEAVCWSDCYETHRTLLASVQGRIIILSAVVRYSDYTGANTLQTTKSSLIFTV